MAHLIEPTNLPPISDVALTEEEAISAIEDEVRKEHPSWNNADIRNSAVRRYYAAQIPEPLKTRLNNGWLQDKEINELFEHYILGL